MAVEVCEKWGEAEVTSLSSFSGGEYAFEALSFIIYME